MTNWKRGDWRGAPRRTARTSEDRWSLAFITHRLRHRGEWRSVSRLRRVNHPSCAFPRIKRTNERTRPLNVFDIVIRIITYTWRFTHTYTRVYLHAYIYIHQYIHTQYICVHLHARVHVHYRGWQSFFYSHLESTHLNQSQQITSAQTVHPLQTPATNLATLVNGDDKRPLNHIQTYR